VKYSRTFALSSLGHHSVSGGKGAACRIAVATRWARRAPLLVRRATQCFALRPGSQTATRPVGWLRTHSSGRSVVVYGDSPVAADGTAQAPLTTAALGGCAGAATTTGFPCPGLAVALA
jgi:hypothetical protein